MRGISCLITLAILGLVARSSYGRVAYSTEFADQDGEDHEAPVDPEERSDDYELPDDTDDDIDDTLEDDVRKYVDDHKSENPDAEILNEYPTHANEDRNHSGLSRAKRDRFNGMDDVSQNGLSYRMRDNNYADIKQKSGCGVHSASAKLNVPQGIPRDFNGKYGIPRRGAYDDDDW